MVSYIQKNDIRIVKFKHNAIFGIYRKTPEIFNFAMKFMSFKPLVKWIFPKNTLFCFRFIFDR